MFALPTDKAGLLAVVSFGGFAAVATVSALYKLVAKPDTPPSSRRTKLTDEGPKPSKLAAAAKMLLCPSVAVGALWYVATHPTAVLKAVPALFSAYGKGLDSVLPVYAKNVHHAFQLGEAHKVFADADGKPAAVAAALKMASDLLSRAVTAAEMARFPEAMRLQASEASMASKVLGAFSIVNIVWFLSICGLSVLLLPFLYQLLAPLRKLIWSLWQDVVYPFLLWCRPAYEPLMYALTLLIAVESARYPRGPIDGVSMTGTMVALTACALFCSSWAYSTYLHSTGGGNRRLWLGLSGILLAGAAAPLAILHQSSLLGYVAVVSVMSALGFTAFGAPLCLFIGFESSEQAIQVAAACLFLTLGNATAKALGVESTFLAPFASAVASYGTAVYFLALSILTFGGYRFSKHFGELVYAANLAAYVVVGEMAGIPGMANAAKVWGMIELFVKYCDYCPKSGGALIVSGFTGCGILYAMSLYLSTHPELIVAAIGAVSSAA